MWFNLVTISALIVCAFAVPLDERADNVCSTGIYKDLSPLKNYPVAVAYCQAKFPPACVSIKAKETRNKVPRQGSYPKRAEKSTSKTSTSKTSTSKTSTSKTSTTTSAKDATSSLWAKATVQPYATISTLCSCIQTHLPCTTSKKSTSTTSLSSSTKITSSTTAPSSASSSPAVTTPIQTSTQQSISQTPTTSSASAVTSSSSSSSVDSTTEIFTSSSISTEPSTTASTTSSSSSSSVDSTIEIIISSSISTEPSTTVSTTSSSSSSSVDSTTEILTSSSTSTEPSTTTSITSTTTTSTAPTTSCTPGPGCSPAGWRYQFYCTQYISGASGGFVTLPAVDETACLAQCDDNLACVAWSYMYQTGLCTTYFPLDDGYTIEEDPLGRYALYEPGDCPNPV
ncbi:hypothetical protein HYFRA_00014092 [Hymenoscyphus fraxineus]|uniref:Apple domain-containing protein n=1 Tax=Hymenoscyphus fraxineus TaxID=746836 RepID=A0A9N9L9H9_9HELO|nr:hypothetical protein HYFRA_00014092 [Hymenoscyphus fraxineus]